MMTKSAIDMSRPNMLYACGLGFIMLVSLAISNVPVLTLSQYLDIPFRREICAGLFMTGAVFGAFAMQRHLRRAKAPWKVPQSQVALPYCVFFFVTLAAVIIAR
ncbi:hypothetical protein D3C71_22380 [compost metagenome]